MKFGSFLRIIAPHILDAACILMLSLAIPIVLLVLYWDQSLFSLPNLLPVANNLQKVGEVILIIIPLASLYIATCVSFLRRCSNDGASIGGLVFSFFFFGPIVLLFVLQPGLYYFLLSRKHQVLPDDDLWLASGLMLGVVGCLFVLEVFMSVIKSLSDITTPWPLPRIPPN